MESQRLELTPLNPDPKLQAMLEDATLLASKASTPSADGRYAEPGSFVDYRRYAESLLKELLDLQANKNADYTMDGALLDNFEAAARITGTTTIQQMLGRLVDKISRIGSLTRRPAAVADEPLNDALHDSIAYLLLMSYATALPYELS